MAYYSGEYGGNMAGFVGGTKTTGSDSSTLGDIGNVVASVFDPFGIWHKDPKQYAYIQTAGSSKYTEAQQRLLQSIVDRYSGLATGEEKVQTYPNKLVADFNAGAEGINQTLQNIISGKSASPDAMRELFSETIEKPMIKSYKENVVPTLQGAFAKKGLSYGTNKQEALETEASTLMDALSKGRATLESNILQNLTQNQLSGVSSAGEFGKRQQETEQQKLTSEYEQWLRNQPGTSPAESMIMRILGLSPVYDQQIMNLAGSGTGGEGGGGIMGMIGSLFG